MAMSYDTKRNLRWFGVGVFSAAVVAGSIYVGTLIGKHGKCEDKEPTVYNIDHNSGTINIGDTDIKTDIRVNTRIKARDVKVSPSYNSNNSTSNITKSGSNSNSGTGNNTSNRTKPDNTIDNTVKEPVRNATNATRYDNTNDAAFKGYVNGVAYFQADNCNQPIRIHPRMYSSIVFRNDSFWYGSVRLSSMPSDMERMLNNQFRSRPSTTKGTYFHPGWKYNNSNDKHW